MDKKFIKTSSLETVAILQKLGFQQIDENNGIYTFLNDGKLLFEKGMDTLFLATPFEWIFYYSKKGG